MRKSTRIFEVWCACTALAYFPTLNEAVAAAPKLIDEYEDEWDDDEAPRIYEESVFDALGVRYHNAIAMYDIDGTLKYKF